MDAAGTGVAKMPWVSLGLGFAVLVASPVAVGILASTGLGMPLGVLILASYVVAIGLGFLVAAYWIGGVILRWINPWIDEPTTWRRIWATALGLVTLALVVLVPFAGLIAASVALLLGVGSLTMQVWSRLRSTNVEG
jgi:hypothetical protein